MTPTSEVDLILQKANIADVIGRYIEVIKKGNSYVAVCPFHDDSSPSLNISTEKKIFKCFACGVGGNAIGFVQRFKSLSFPEALAEVGKSVGVDIKVNSNIKPKYSTIQEKIIAINEDAVNYFSTMLFTKEGEGARKYLEDRKVSLQEIRTYDIGFAKQKYNLYNYLREKKNYSVAEIEASALFRKSGLTYLPIFFNRLIFPITDFDGKVIGFSGRVIEKKENVPKYLNTSENPLFKKSHIAYNFHNAESAIRIKNEIIILEGYMDVISLNRIGVKNSVAIMGTSLSEFHIKEFQKLTSNFTIFLDGDGPGVNATFKLIKQLSNYDLKIKVVFNQTNLDPDELIRDGEKQKVIDMIEKAKLPSEFALEVAREKISTDDSLEKKDEALKNVFEILQFDKSEVHANNIQNMLATLLNVDVVSIKNEFAKFISENKKVERKSSNMNVEEKKVQQNIQQVKHVQDEMDLIAEQMQNDHFDYDSNVIEESYFIPNELPIEEITNEMVPKIFVGTGLDFEYKSPTYYFAVYILVIAILNNLDLVKNNTTITALLDGECRNLLQTIFDIKNEHPEYSEREILIELQNGQYIVQ
ncbi:hypothetical protein Zmor_016453 [Zophobas morio]|uniref:Toprim domain-containing protein n=1 Tax=Zophobas morio TaxID=2755281 RepID=A0AA38HJB2_9CUCU|nr:hypothetical protein Zmor_016453 [Zophobas morio]